jgi:hypothetical protein
MKTHGERSSISAVPTSEAQPEETFGPPGETDLASLTDGRRMGEYWSVYPWYTWVQIGAELIYLLILLAGCSVSLIFIAKYVVWNETAGPVFDLFGKMPESNPLVCYAAMGLAGTSGGCASALKWLYHTVAKQRWHQDRCVWRIVVPILSGELAIFAGLMIVSGIVPFLSKTPLMSPATAAAFGFFVGFFSDNVLAALQKVAYRVFGTVDKGPASKGED